MQWNNPDLPRRMARASRCSEKQHVLSDTGKARYNHSLLIWCLVPSLLDTEMHYYILSWEILMPLVNYFNVSALTKANISLNIIPVCIFHSCLVSKESICPLRSALLWQRNDAQHYSCYEAVVCYHLFPLSCKKWGAAQSGGWTSQLFTMHRAALPDTNNL